jgi:hypothetical protein
MSADGKKIQVACGCGYGKTLPDLNLQVNQTPRIGAGDEPKQGDMTIK